MKRFLLAVFIFLCIVLSLLVFTNTKEGQASTAVPKAALMLLHEYIQTSLDSPNANTEKYLHPDAFFLGTDVFSLVVIPNGKRGTWKVESATIVYESINPEKSEKERLVKIVVNFPALAQATVTNKLIFNKLNEPFKVTFYFAQSHGKWLIYDMSIPEFNIMRLNQAISYTEETANGSGNPILYQLIDRLKKLQ